MKYKNNDLNNHVFRLFLKLFGKYYTKKLWERKVISSFTGSSGYARCGIYNILANNRGDFLEFAIKTNSKFVFEGGRTLDRLNSHLIDYIINGNTSKILEYIMLVTSPLSEVIYRNLNKKLVKNIDFNLQCNSDVFGSSLFIVFHITSDTLIYLKINTLYSSSYILVNRHSFGNKIEKLLEDYYAVEDTCINAARILNDNFV